MPESVTTEDDIDTYIEKLSEDFSSEDWANKIINSPAIKKGLRSQLLSQLSHLIKEAQDSAVRKWRRENV